MAHSITVSLLAATGSFETDMVRAAKAAKKSADSIEKSFQGLASSLKGGVLAIAGGLTVGAFVDMTREAINSIDALNDLADATGSSVENLSALEDVALRTGTSMDTAGSAIIKMSKALADAKPDSDAFAAFKALNLNIKELKSLDPVEAFRRIAVALSGFANDANKARLTQEIFGKSLKEVAPLLKDVAEKGALNATVTSDQAAAAETFNKNLSDMNKNLQDLGRTLLGPLVTGFNSMADGIRKVNEERAKGKGWWESLNTGLAREFPRFAFGADPDNVLGRRADEFSRSRFLRGDKDTTPADLPSVGDVSGGKKKKEKDKPWPTDTLLMYQADQLRDAFEAIDKINKEWKPVEFVNAANLYEAELLVNAFEEIDKVNKEFDEKAKKAAEKTQEAVRDLGLTFSSAFEDAIVEGEKLSDVLKALEKDILRIVWRKLVTEPMAAWVSQVATAAGSAFGTWMGGSSGSAAGSAMVSDSRGGFVPVLASGTNYVPQDTFAMLHKGEAVLPKEYNPYAGGEALGQRAMNVEVNNYGSDEVRTRQGPDGRAIIDIVRRESVRAVAADTGAGGATARATAGRFGVNNGATLNRRRG